RAFGDSVDTASESETFEMLEKPRGKTPERVQVGERGLVESQRFQVRQHVVESTRQQQVAPRGKTAHEQAENGLVRHALVEIGLKHRERIEVGQEDLADRRGVWKMVHV